MTIVLLTDLGLRDAYVGMIKGVIASISPETRLIDLSHQVAPGNIREGAFDLFVSARYFPSGTIFCCVVDPGAGSHRRAVALKLESEASYTFVGPDNGLFTGVMVGANVTEAVALENLEYRLSEVSNTFHGRDIFAPAAAHLSKGVALRDLGPSVRPDTLVQLPWNEPQRQGQGWDVRPIYADQFGNLVTNLSASALQPDPTKWHVKLGRTDIGPIRRTFSDVRVGHPLAYVGSSGLLELAIRDGSAEDLLNLGSDSVISVLPMRS